MENYFIYNASAGAGKTYTLVQHFLLKLFSYPNNDGIKHILAVTFTNKAANEMKTRIINQLQDMIDVNDAKSVQYLQEMADASNCTIPEIQAKAKSNLQYILHHYSYFSVSTIDKFNVRLLKSFAKELGLSHSFSVEISDDKILLESIDKLIDGLGENESKLLTNVILDFVDSNMEADESVHFQKELLSTTQRFLSETNYQQLQSISQFDIEFFQDLKTKLYKRISQSEQQLESTANQVIALCDSLSLTNDDFNGKSNGLLSFFHKILQGKSPSTSTLEKYIHEDKIANSKATSEKKIHIESIQTQLSSAFFELIETANRIQLDKAVAQKIFYLQLQQELQQKLQVIKSEQDVILISDFNKLISNHLQEQPAQFIYEKIGGKIQHFFFDEFQDTSEMQWNNFLPLVEETISHTNQTVTIVGDPKQSIYRFRAGKPEIMLNLIEESKPHEQMKTISLEHNFRSRENIVNFNNNLYQSYASYFVEGAYQTLFEDYSHQNPKGASGGNVSVFLAPKEDNETSITNRMIELIKQCDSKGYKRNELAILVRKKSFLNHFIEAFAEEHIELITDEAVTLEQSLVAQTFVLFIEWKQNSDDAALFARFLVSMSELKSEWKQHQHTIAQQFADSEISPAFYLKEKLGIDIDYIEQHSISFANYVETFFQELQLENQWQTEMTALLDLVYELESNSSISEKEFLQFWEEKGKKFGVNFPENENAIRVMTVHKSKGLEFPVVLYPNYAKRKNNRHEYWIPLEAERYDGLPNFYLKSLKSIPNYQDLEAIKDEKIQQSEIDELCVHYVATTRAEKELHILDVAFNPNANASQDNVDSIFNKYVANNFPNECTSDEPKTYTVFNESTEIESKPTVQHSDENDVTIQWISNNSFPLLQISTESVSRLKYGNEQQEYGELLHHFLSKIYTEKDIENVVQKAVQNGILRKEEAEIFTHKLQQIIHNQSIHAFFSEDVTSYNEREFLYQGKTFRPDKVVQKDSLYYVIDYKTGVPKAEHKTQVNQYKEQLNALHLNVAKSYLVYTENQVEVVEV